MKLQYDIVVSECSLSVSFSRAVSLAVSFVVVVQHSSFSFAVSFLADCHGLCSGDTGSNPVAPSSHGGIA